jgi:hypothetical protein
MNDKYIRDFIIESELLFIDDLNKVDDYVFEKNVGFLNALLETRLLDQEILSKVCANIMGVSQIRLREKTITLESFKMIPEPISREHDLICFSFDGKNLDVAFFNIESLGVLENFFSSDINLRFFLADHEDILEKKEKYAKLLSEELFFKSQNSVSKISKIENWGIKSEKDLPENFRKDIANDLYTEKFIKSILHYAVNNKADFIFFNISEENVSVSVRIAERNYSLMEIEKGVLFSVLLKLKMLSDIDIFEDFQIKQSFFIQEFLKKKYNIFLTFVRTDFGESVTIQIDGGKKFKTETCFLTKKQRDLFLPAQKKDSGFLIVSGEGEEEKKKTLYSFLEFDVEKNKEIYLLEKEILYPLDYTKQILIKSSKNVLSFLSKIFQNFPDVLFVEKVSPAILPMLFNYVSTSKKVFVSNDLENGKFLSMLLERDFDKGQIVKNFSLFIEHRFFIKLHEENRKKYFLKKDEIKVLKDFLTESEMSNIFKEEGLVESSEKSISKVEFFVYKNDEKCKSFFASKKSSKKNHKKLSVRGVISLGLFLENCFLKRYSEEKTKNYFRKEIKKSVLENALVAGQRGEVDIREVLKYLTSY